MMILFCVMTMKKRYNNNMTTIDFVELMIVFEIGRT